jgi:diketogulonate reductase-like aldo/keto reductase
MNIFTASSRPITLNNGVQMPALGLGVFLSQPEQTAAAVEAAIRSGYRLIDTAAAYFNERQVGEGIRRSGIDRSEMFVTTKLWMSDYGYDATLRAFDVSLGKLGLDYLDLYLLHWPVPTHFERTVASYRAAERLLAEGRTRAIGVSNFSATHLDNLLARAAVMPAVNQIELNPFFIQRDLRNTHEDLGIVTQSWSPIGGVSRNALAPPQAARNPLEHPVIVDLGTQYGKTPAQIVLRWHMEHGLSAIPKSVRPERIAENIGILDFSLRPDEVAAIDGLDTGLRAGPDPESVAADTWPLTIEG